MASASCQPETILTSKTCDIHYCPDCGMIHLNMGSITVRMSEQHFANFAIDVSKGLFTMRQREQSVPSRMLM